MLEEMKSSSDLFYIAGVGASAGGLEALKNMLDHTPPDTGISFIIVQHLSPNHKSFMAELLSRHTEMDMLEIRDKQTVEPNKVYILPPKYTLSIRGRTLFLHELHEPHKAKTIDLFFQSLAEAQGDRAIGIILSGTGSDGSKGIEFIKESGGITIVQQESNAKFDGMPKSAIQTGLADFILPVERIGTEIRNIIRADHQDFRLETAHPQMADLSSEVSAIIDILREHLKIDFSPYKISSVSRRIEKRMAINRIYQIKEYVQFLKANPDETLKLKRDLLIGVTAFFRDPQAFEDLASEVIPRIFENKKEEKEIRIWSAGCSTGEEAYSLAILFRMYMEQQEEQYHIKIFATDLDERAIEYASQGLYPDSIAGTVPEDILQRYFIKKREGYQVQDAIRKMIVFAHHNILQNPPFINLDLIACRNLLIYFQTSSQRKVLSLFHFALHAKGFLFLGSSETVGKSSHYFDPHIRKSNIYKYKESSRFFVSNTSTIRFEDNMIHRMNATRKYHALNEFPSVSSTIADIETALMREYVPAMMIIDDNNRMIYSSGPVNKIIRMPQGEPTNNILKLIPDEELAVAVRAAIHRVRREGIEVFYYDIKRNVDNKPQQLYLKAKPFKMNGQSDLIILYFDEVGPKAPSTRVEDPFNANNDLMKRIDELEVELQHTKEYLQITKEELETSNEELQSTNEELIAANEELQSSNEELQSLNEELLTVNNDYQEKIEQLTELTDDINNLLISTNIGTIFLDRNLCIRRFTPSVTNEVNLIEVDIGRPLSHISHTFQYNGIMADARQVLQTAQTVEKEIATVDGKWFTMRVLPYFSKKRNLDGVVITFNDITDLKKLNEHLQLLSYAIEQSPISIAIFNMRGEAEYVNPQLIKVTGYSREDILGKHFNELIPKQVANGKTYSLWDKVKSGETWSGEMVNTRRNGDPYWEEVTLLPITDDKDSIIRVLKVAEDVTERKATEKLLLESEMQSAIGQLAAGIAHEIRNPLTALKGFTKLMQGGNHNPEYTRIMGDELDRINLIVNELLFLTKPRAAEFEDRNIIAIIKEVVGLLETQAIMNNCEIVMDLEVEKYNIRCVEHQLKQVFINIIKNAIEAMPKGGQVTVNARLRNESIRICIQDQGEGIPEKILSKIGKPFFTTKEKGTGLGLMVCQKIIQNHDGKMTIDSKVKEGTTIGIVLV